MDKKIISTILTAPVVTVADIETTGFSMEKGACIIEIGAVKIDTEHHKVIEGFSTFIKPTIGNVPKRITELTTITNDDVKDAPNIEDVLESFYDFIQDAPVVFHNAGFDWTRFLLPSFKKVGKEPQNICIDTVSMSKFLHPTMTKHNLEILTEMYGCPIANDTHHRAIVDSKYTASLFLKMKDELAEKCPGGILSPTLAPNHFCCDENKLRILKIKPWTKGSEKRVYVTTNYGDFCYDYVRETWFISRIKEGIEVDRNACTKKIIELTQIENIEELYERNIS